MAAFLHLFPVHYRKYCIVMLAYPVCTELLYYSGLIVITNEIHTIHSHIYSSCRSIPLKQDLHAVRPHLCAPQISSFLITNLQKFYYNKSAIVLLYPTLLLPHLFIPNRCVQVTDCIQLTCVFIVYALECLCISVAINRVYIMCVQHPFVLIKSYLYELLALSCKCMCIVAVSLMRACVLLLH